MLSEKRLKAIALIVGTLIKAALVDSCLQGNVPAAVFWFFIEWRLDTILRFPTD